MGSQKGFRWRRIAALRSVVQVMSPQVERRIFFLGAFAIWGVMLAFAFGGCSMSVDLPAGVPFDEVDIAIRTEILKTCIGLPGNMQLRCVLTLSDLTLYCGPCYK